MSLVILGVAVGLLIATAWAAGPAHYPGTYYYTDCQTSSPHNEDIGYALEYGVAGGYGGGIYGPNDPVTRQQMASFIMRQGAADTTMAWAVIDNLYFDGYYFGLAGVPGRPDFLHRVRAASGLDGLVGRHGSIRSGTRADVSSTWLPSRGQGCLVSSEVATR